MVFSSAVSANRALVWLAVFLAFFVCCGCPRTGGQTGGSVNVFVTDQVGILPQSSQPCARIIELAKTGNYDSATGSFVFTELPPGAVTIQVSAFGYVTTRVQVDVIAGQIATVSLVLTAA